MSQSLKKANKLAKMCTHGALVHAVQVIFCKILIVPGYKSNPGCKSTPTLSPSIFSRKRSTYNRKNTVAV